MDNSEVIPYLAGIGALVGATMLAYIGTARLALWLADAGLRWRVVSVPSDRSSHAEPTSRLGGVALAIGFFVPTLVLVLALKLMPDSRFGIGGNLALMGWIALGAAGMFAVGLADDIWDLPPISKLAGQILAALAIPAASLGFFDTEMPALLGLSVPASEAVWAVAWVVFFVNAYNFMDGSDGLAIRLVVAIYMFVMVSILTLSVIGSYFLAMRLEFYLIMILGAAAQGFYRVNKAPAKIFMGDSGSLMIGYLLAVLVFLADGRYFALRPEMTPIRPWFVAPALVIMYVPFIFDVLLTLVRRASRGENILAAHRSHLYQRLLIAGMSHRDVLRKNLIYFRLCGLAGFLYAVGPSIIARLPLELTGLQVVRYSIRFRYGIWIAVALMMIHYWRFVLRTERDGPPPATPEAPAQATT